MAKNTSTTSRASVGKGQTVVRAFPIDKSSAGGEGSLKGAGSFGGSITNLAHSLPGTSANQKGPR